MSTVQRVNFEPSTDVLPLIKRDHVLADPTLANPNNAVALVDGEWVTLNSVSKLVRAADITVLGSANANGRATLKSFPLWMEKGRSDSQSIAGTKMAVIYRGEWEADTRIFDASATVASGAPITTILQPLKVATIAIGSRNYCGIVGHGGSGDTAPIVGYVSKLPAVNGGKLRMISGGRL